jgi:DNA end-binding protein Ku
MARPLWKGAIRFSIVSIPVKLYTATEEKDVRFNLLHSTDHARIRQKRFCTEEDIELESDEIVRGYEVSPGHYVVVEDEDLENVPVNTTHEIEITEFVNLDQIDPILYQKTYYLEPEDIGMKPFALLMRALKESGLVAIAKVTLRQKEQLCSLRLYENTIALETMFYSDEVRPTQELTAPDNVEVSDRDLAMAKLVVEGMTNSDFDYGQYKDNYREALLEVIQKKAEGEVVEAPAPAAAKITDLTEALRASVEEIRRRKAAEPEAEPSRGRARARAS